MNKLYYGDCLTIMQSMGKDAVDLIYLDPPFNSNRAYNAIYKDETGRPLPDQIEAFCDLWTLDSERQKVIRQMPKLMVSHGIDDSVADFWKVWMKALANTNPKLLAYLSYMTERLLQMKIILRPTGSIYLHCDPTCSHYIKVIMDGIFGEKNFRNEIVWCYSRPSAPNQRQLSRVHDIVFWYTNGNQWVFNPDLIRQPYADSSRAREGYSAGASKVASGSVELNTKGKFPESWIYIPPLKGNSREYKGYPTQKPLRLMHRIIKSSSNEGDVVLDPFCGCATTLVAAQELNRKWIGIDIAIHAIKRVSAIRLQEDCQLTEGIDYEISGIPRTLEGAKDLWSRDTYQFQKWAVEMVDGFVTARKSRDGGVDGRIYFPDGEGDDLKAMKVEVKGGETVKIESLRALAGVIDEEDYPMGGFITRKTLGRLQKQNFLDFCRTKGEIEIGGQSYPRLQILSVEEIFEGKQFRTPLVRGRSTTDQLRFDLSD